MGLMDSSELSSCLACRISLGLGVRGPPLAITDGLVLAMTPASVVHANVSVSLKVKTV